jgi:hypothetical protein
VPLQLCKSGFLGLNSSQPLFPGVEGRRPLLYKAFLGGLVMILPTQLYLLSQGCLLPVLHLMPLGAHIGTFHLDLFGQASGLCLLAIHLPICLLVLMPQHLDDHMEAMLSFDDNRLHLGQLNPTCGKGTPEPGE